MLRRLQGLIARGVVTLVNSALKMQLVQLQALGGNPLDGLEHFEAYGFTANPLPGAEGIVLNVGAHAGNAIVVCVADRRYRLAGLASGEVAIYDNQGQSVVLHADHVAVNSPNKVVITAPETDVISNSINLGGAGGAAVARVGDAVNLSTGQIMSGSAKVKSL